ncbi:MAG: FliM/FliN family flagellar motor switch protein [Leptospira sp.]|nr:FliM/FliN family flagellar motor switch protein [Leptospira sp.]
MTEILSQDEIDSLLNAISSGEVNEDEYSSVGEQKKVKIYDFKRPDKFSKDQIRTLQMMHETFARLATTGLSAVMEGIIVRILGNLRESWSTVIDLRPRLGNIETNPQFAQVVPPNDMVVLITLETKVGEVEGMTNLCIPYITIEPIINKLSAQYWYSSIRRGETDENKAVIQERLDQVTIPLVTEIGSVDIAMMDLMGLQVGDVIKLENTPTKADMMIKVGDRSKFKCTPGKVGNRLAVQIGETIDEIPDELLGSTRSEQEY